MDIEDLLNKAKDALANASDEQIEGASEQVKGKTPDQVDGFVDKAADFLQGQNDK